jgi:hypothetical protein
MLFTTRRRKVTRPTVGQALCSYSVLNSPVYVVAIPTSSTEVQHFYLISLLRYLSTASGRFCGTASFSKITKSSFLPIVLYEQRVLRHPKDLPP